MLKGLGNLANLGSILKQAQQMGSQMEGLNEKLKARRVTGAAGGGLVEVESNGLGQIVAVKIDPGLIEKGEREMIEDLLPAACNQAQTRARELHAEAVREMTSDIELPGLEEALGKLTGGTEPPGDEESS